MMIFDFLIPYREFGSLPGYHAITFEPLRGNLRYSYNFLTLCFINIPQRGKYLHDQWIKGKSFQRRKTRVNIGDLEGESRGAVDSRRSAVGGPGLVYPRRDFSDVLQIPGYKSRSLPAKE